MSEAQTTIATQVLPETGPWSLYKPARRWLFLAVLFLATLCSMTDRYLMSILLEPIKKEFHASDTVMGFLTGFAFAAFYAVLGLPIARWADRGDRRVIISLSLAVWSAMSAFCGVAKSLPILALARFGVGIGEAGAQPPVFSLVPDYFPPLQRGRAISLLVLSSTFGIVIAYIAGAQISAAYGWRAAFLWLSLPGIPLAALAYFLLDEPRRKMLVGKASEAHERIGETIRVLLRKRSMIYGLLGFSIYMLVVGGAFLWLPAYMQRVLNVNLASEGALYGLASMVVPIVGSLVGGWLLDRLTKVSVSWMGWLPAIGVAIALPLYEFAFLTHSYVLLLVFSVAATLPLSLAVPAMTTLVLAVSGARRRSLATSVNLLLSSLIGVGGGSLLTGAVSDSLTHSFGVAGLRYALMAITASLALCAALYAAAAPCIKRDIED
jgi:predicted MFS family arabinose efflux permease